MTTNTFFTWRCPKPLITVNKCILKISLKKHFYKIQPPSSYQVVTLHYMHSRFRVRNNPKYSPFSTSICLETSIKLNASARTYAYLLGNIARKYFQWEKLFRWIMIPFAFGTWMSWWLDLAGNRSFWQTIKCY